MDNRVSEKKIDEARLFYNDQIIGGMLSNLEKSLEIKVHYMTALSCFVYTEIIGNFLPKVKGESGSYREKSFHRALYRFPSSQHIKQVDSILKETNKSVYQNLRHSLCHSYHPSVQYRKNGKVYFARVTTAREVFFKIQGIKIEARSPIGSDMIGGFFISTKNYVSELRELVNKSYKKTFEEKDSEYQKSAAKGIDLILRGI